MSVLRRVAALLGMVAVVLGVVLAAPSAQAETTTGDKLPVVSGDALAAGWDTAILVAPGRDSCPQFYLCVWTGPNFTGSGLGLSGTISPNDWISWFGTVWENDVESAVNKTTIPVTFMDIHGDYYYDIGALYPGYDFTDGWPHEHEADGIIYLP